MGTLYTEQIHTKNSDCKWLERPYWAPTGCSNVAAADKMDDGDSGSYYYVSGTVLRT